MNHALKIQLKIGLLMMILSAATYTALSLSNPSTIQTVRSYFGSDATTVIPFSLMVFGAVMLFAAIRNRVLTALQFAVLTGPLLFYIAATIVVTIISKGPATAAVCYLALYWIAFDDVRERT